MASDLRIRRPSPLDVAAARAILAAEEAAIAREIGSLVDPKLSRLLYRAEQVSYSLPCYGIKVVPGLQLGFCEWANRTFGDHVPSGQPRFILGTVTSVEGDMMEIEYDSPPRGVGLGINCSVKEYSKFCIPLPRDRHRAITEPTHD